MMWIEHDGGWGDYDDAVVAALAVGDDAAVYFEEALHAFLVELFGFVLGDGVVDLWVSSQRASSCTFILTGSRFSMAWFGSARTLSPLSSQIKQIEPGHDGCRMGMVLLGGEIIV